MGDGRFSGTRILAEVQLPSFLAGGNSAYELVFWSNPVDLLGWGDRGRDLLLAQDASLSGQFAPQLKLRTVAQEAALKGAQA